MKRIICSILFVALRWWILFPQDYRIENITSEYIRIEKGLSQNTVNCILQDQDGYLWAGTWSGLNRFDGYTFKIWSADPLLPQKGLVQGNIIGLAEDRLGYIWAASPRGLNRINKNDFSITRFTVETHRDAGLVCDSINALYGDRKGLIWIGTSCGALILDPEKLSFTHLEHNPRNNETISSNFVTAFAEDSSGSMWIGTRNGLNKFIPTTGMNIRFMPGDGSEDLASGFINCLTMDADNNLWIGTPEGLCTYRNIRRSFRYYPLMTYDDGTIPTDKNNITSLLYDRKGNLWVGTLQSGLHQFNPISRTFTNMQTKIPESGYFSYNSFLTLMQDRYGLFWLGTSHKGLVKLVPDPHAFYEIIPSYSVYGIAEVKPGEYWFGTQEGVVQFNRSTQRTNLLQQSKYNPNSISGNLITNLIHEPPYVWICTRTGLNRYHTETRSNRIFRPSDQVNSVAGSLFWNVTRASDGKYWFASDRGVSVWDPETDRISNYQHNPTNPNSLSNNYCLQVFEAEPGIFLISTQNGLSEFNTANQTWKNYYWDPGNITTLSSNYIFGIYEDHEKELWVYTNGGGICQFDRKSGTFERYTTQDGLADNIVYGMLQDKDGIFWITTNQGLSRFDPRDGKFNNFDVQDGLFSNEFNIHGIMEASNGEILLGGVNGVNAFLPQTTLRTSQTPLIHITGFTCHSDTASIEVPITDTIRLPFSSNTFSISFSLLDYLNPFKNQFRYYLDNFDRDRTNLSPGFHTVDYRRVPPGHYTFHVSGTNSLGVSSEEAILNIVIIPAWYQTFGFKFMVVFFFVVVIGSFIWLRLYSLRNRHEMEKQLLTTQAELIRSQKFALRSQMNPHFIFNSLNSIQNFVLKNDVDSANYYLSNFSILMRKVLEYSQYNFISLNEELEMIHLYLKMEHMRFTRKFEYTINVSPEIDQHMVKIPPMLLQPYLENAILHGLQLIKHKGLLQVLIEDQGDFMTIRIVDNGIGRERARAIRERTGHKSKGLANIEKRIQLYNKISDKHLSVTISDLFNDQNEPAGTQVEIRIPFDLEEQSKEIF